MFRHILYYVTSAFLLLHPSICYSTDYKSDKETEKRIEALLEKMTPEEKKKILEEEYEIPMSENIETEVNNMCSYIDTVYNEAMRIGNEQGEKRGEESMAMLGRQLLEENRIDELMKSYDNVEYRNKLMDQYGIK